MNVRVLPVTMVELAPMAYTALHVIARRNTQVLHALKVSNFVEGIQHTIAMWKLLFTSSTRTFLRMLFLVLILCCLHTCV